MNSIELLKNFIAEVKENDNFWLLEAKPGLFAMVEDANENSFIPVWCNEQDALDSASEEPYGRAWYPDPFPTG